MCFVLLCCHVDDFQMKRWKKIRDERVKQFVRGERDRPFEENYPERIDSLIRDFYSHNPSQQ